MTGQVGKVYADAVFDLCLEEDTLEPVYKDLNACAAVFRKEPGLAQLLEVPTIPREEKRALVERLFAGNQTVVSLVCMLTQRQRIPYVQAVADAFNDLYREHKGIARMTVTTCVPLRDTQRQQLIAALQKKYGKQVELTERIDPAILGGVIVQYGDTLLDNSVRSRLEAVRRQLKQ